MNETPIIIIKNKYEVLYLRLDNILYIQADGNYSDIHLVDGGVLKTLSYQRAEIARMMEEQQPEYSRRFVIVGRSYMVNTDYVMRIQPGKQLLTFRVNLFGTARKVVVYATSNALIKLAKDMSNRVACGETHTL